MYPILNIGPAIIPTAPLLLIIGLYLSLSVVERAAKMLGLAAVQIYEVCANALIAGFLLARLAFVAAHWDSFRAAPLSIIWPLNSGYMISAGVVGGLLILIGSIYRAKLPVRPTISALLPAILTLFLFISLSDFIARPAAGTITTIPWAIESVGLSRHPIELYEIGVAILGLIVWWWMAREQPERAFWLTIVVYGFGRFFIDAFRSNAPVLSSGYHIIQLLLLPLVLFAIYRLFPVVETTG
ncbi:MAG TPA: hypothetical protein ENJ56_02905 [Anaerolineae bacterium]|nr:hypothetical protein [Anaerolineae bacterium]